MHRGWRATVGAVAIAAAVAGVARAGEEGGGQPPGIAIHRSADAITVDGDLSEPGWRGASEVRTWFETNPGDNLEPGVEEVSRTFDRTQLHYTVDVSPSRRFARFLLTGRLGDEVDFTEARLGTGARVELNLTLRPTDHIELRLLGNRRWLDLDLADGRSGRLFTAQVSRLRGVYTINARSWLRLIAQYVETDRNLSLYDFTEVEPESAFFSGSAVFAYKLNWQTVLFLGYGDDRERSEADELEPASRQLFLKVSYAFQR